MPPRKILQYEEDVIRRALEDCSKGQPISSVAKKWKIPRSTLRSKFKGITPISRKMGRQTVFSAAEESRLEEWVLQLTKDALPLSKSQFMRKVSCMAQESKKKAFQDRPPSKKWYQGFLSRHPTIAKRIGKNLTRGRPAVTQDEIQEWEEEVFSTMDRDGHSHVLEESRRVFSADEAAFFLNPKEGKVLAARGDKTIYQCAGKDEKENVTVLITANAAGDLAPPMIVYRYAKVPPSAICETIPKEWGIGIRSRTGWVTCELFYEYIGNIFLPWLKKNEIERPVVLFVDGRVPYLSLELSELCRENDIVLVTLPRNATHLLHPTEVAVFPTLKMHWQEKVQKYRMDNGKHVTKITFVGVVKDLIQENLINHPSILQNGFRKCGLFPWCPAAIKIDRKQNATEKDPRVRKNDRLTWLESRMGSAKVKLFQQGTVHVQDKSLFEVWKIASENN